MNVFGLHAKAVVEQYNPKTFLDAGCAFGYFVAALRDQGVEAYGIDSSEYAIEQAIEDIKQFVKVQNPLVGCPEDFPDSLTAYRLKKL